MAENDLGAITGISSPVIQKFSIKSFPYATEDVGGLQNALKVSTEVDVTLTYASEKLVNLETLLLHVLGGDHDVGSSGLENDKVSSELIEKCFTIDLLHSMLNFELRELDSLLCDIQELIVDALQKISSYDQPTEILNLVSKFHDSEELLKQLQERILEMKIQLTKLQMTSFSFKQNEWKQDLITNVNELPLVGTEWKPQIQKVEQRRVIRMLAKCLEKELELEKSLAELKQNEQDHNVKIRLVEQVSACMEEAAEVAWARFLEADNRAEILMGISKEILGKLQIFQFNECGTANREEEENKCKLQDCLIKLREKDTSIQNLKSNISQLVNENAELKSLKEKAQILEKKLNVAESRLKEANAEVEKSQQQVKEMEIEVESLRGNIYTAESRFRTAEEKNTHLNESNMELTEELEFLKGSNDSNSKKVSVLEKQLRDLDIQLQNARASSEASQEQQNMLYSAIWDMETLIDELKQKVTTSESKTENVEERCVMLSETNFELNKELNILRSRLKFTENSLDQFALERKSSANDISARASIIMDTVVQLAKERERIQKQLIYLMKENSLLREKTKMKSRSECSFVDKIGDEKVLRAAGQNLHETESGKFSLIIANEITSEICQVELLNNTSVVQKEMLCASHSTTFVPQLEVESRVETGKSWRKYMLMTLLVLLLSVLAAHLFNHAPLTF